MRIRVLRRDETSASRAEVSRLGVSMLRPAPENRTSCRRVFHLPSVHWSPRDETKHKVFQSRADSYALGLLEPAEPLHHGTLLQIDNGDAVVSELCDHHA